MMWLSGNTLISYKTINNFRSSDAIKELIKETDIKLIELEEEIKAEPRVIKGGSKNKHVRRKLKSIKRKLKEDFLPRKVKYERDREIFKDRNSFSKIDTDATFMRLKEDHMQNGQLKPAYNLQIATSGRFVLHYDIFPNPTDTRTLVPFLKSFSNLDLFKHIVADAGYDSEINYQAVIDKFEKIPLIPYGTYQKEQSRKYQRDPQNINIGHITIKMIIIQTLMESYLSSKDIVLVWIIWG
ncbi:transposase [Ligilactobacillus sp. Marseille-Q7487]|uniref:transposase n=1 Tax=Ligilactobacillus sp. Marseille-Q7487 TaxID=3022128 RepID=UPI0032C1D982